MRHRPQSSFVRNAVACAAAMVLGAVAPARAQVGPNCTVSILNRTVTQNADGSWVLPNVPANFGPVRARVTCLVNGQTISGESDPFTVTANGVVNLPPIKFGQTTPIPTSLTLAAPTTTLTSIGQTTQLTVTARYGDNTTKDVTAGNNFTQYTVTNAAIATVTGDGLVQAVKSGTVLIQATHEGASGMASIRVVLAGVDTDGDGIPDDYELAHGMNPNNPTDAFEDFERDGLSNLQEYQLDTDPRSADTDADGLKDGDEFARGTNPLLRDTDGDGISDGLEVQTASNPLDPNSYNLTGVLTSIAVVPSIFTLTFNTIAADVSVQLKLTGTLRDGTSLDVTAKQGVNYGSSDLNICNFSAARGRVFAGQAGGCAITATVGSFTAVANGTVHTFSPTALSSVGLGGAVNGVDVGGNFVYAAVSGVGLKVVDVTNRSAPHIAATLNLPGSANDVKLSGARAYFAAGAAGLHVIDVSNPFVPKLLGSVDTPGSANDIRVRGNLAFVADGPGGLQIIDVTGPSIPRIVGSAATAAPANGVDVADALAVVAVGSSGIQIADVTNPSNPIVVGGVDTPGDAQDVIVKGTFAYVADYTGSLRAVDFGTPGAPMLRGTTPGSLGGYLFDVAMADTFVFGADIFFVNGVPIVDVSDPDNLRPRAILNFPGDATGLGIAVDGSYLYLGTDTGVLYVGQYRIQEDLNGVPPTASIASPVDGATFVEGETIPVSVLATDDLAVVGVSLQVNGTVVGTDTTAPYQFNVTAPVGATALTFQASAVDLGQNVGMAVPVEVNVIPDPLTTLTGRVTASTGIPVAGAAINCLGRPGLTLSDGSFTVSGVPTTQPDVVCRASTTSVQGVLLGGSSARAVSVRGGTTPIGDIAIGPIPVITSLSRKFALFNTTIQNFVVTGASLTDTTFSFQTNALTIVSASVNSDGASANLTLSVGNQAGTFALVATNTFGTSSIGTRATSWFTVIDPNSTADTDGDGIPDVVEIVLGSDPFDPSSLPNLNVPTSGEVDAQSFAVLNTSLPTSTATSQEADATAFSALNLADVTGGQTLGLEADGRMFSVMNGAGTIGTVSSRETDGSMFSVMNGAGTTGTVSSREADALMFSVMNGSGTAGTASNREANAQAFSVMNGAGTTGQVITSEADATAFSALNLAAMTGGQTPHLEADATGFSVLNTDTGAPLSAQSDTGSGGGGGGGQGGGSGGPPVNMEADAIAFSVNNLAPGAPPAALWAVAGTSSRPLGLAEIRDLQEPLFCRPVFWVKPDVLVADRSQFFASKPRQRQQGESNDR